MPRRSRSPVDRDSDVIDPGGMHRGLFVWSCGLRVAQPDDAGSIQAPAPEDSRWWAQESESGWVVGELSPYDRDILACDSAENLAYEMMQRHEGREDDR
jgi:hypothetical protein